MITAAVRIQATHHRGAKPRLVLRNARPRADLFGRQAVHEAQLARQLATIVGLVDNAHGGRIFGLMIRLVIVVVVLIVLRGETLVDDVQLRRRTMRAVRPPRLVPVAEEPLMLGEYQRHAGQIVGQIVVAQALTIQSAGAARAAPVAAADLVQAIVAGAVRLVVGRVHLHVRLMDGNAHPDLHLVNGQIVLVVQLPGQFAFVHLAGGHPAAAGRGEDVHVYEEEEEE